MPVVTLSTPLDLTGAAPTNLFTNELVQFNTSLERFFVPSKGPFYTTTLEIRHGVTNALLQPETQFKILHPVKEAIRMSGKEVCTAIYITDTSIPSVRLTYRVIGGIFADTASEIGDIIANNPLPPSSEVSWWDILDKPDQFTPSEHLHHVDNIYGMSDVVAVLENIRIAILAGDSVAIGAIYQYINVLLSNLEYATENYVDDTFAQLDSTPYVRTFKTYNDLRAFSDLVNNDSYIYLATGKNAVNDRKGKVFMWDNTCTINDDDEDIIRPNHISVGIPGRFVSVLIIESKFKLLAASLGRAFDTEGNLLSSFNSTGRIFEGDLNTLVEQGPWLFTAASTNKPTRMTSLSSNPMAIGEGYINVTKLDGKVIQEVLMAGLDVSPNSEFIAQSFKRAGLETAPGSGTYTWSRWDATASQNTLARFGIDRAIAAENSLPSTSDLDLLVAPGKYWFGDSQDNRPFDWGVLEVELVGGSIVAPGEVYQYAYWDGRKASRSRNYLGVWSEWSFSQTKDLLLERDLSGIDLDTVILPDTYYYDTTSTNKPDDTFGIVTVKRFVSNYVFQEAHTSNNDKYTRYMNNNVWGAWARPPNSAEVLAAAEQIILPTSLVLQVHGTATFSLNPRATVRLFLQAGGGGGGCCTEDGVGTTAGAGGDTILRNADTPSIEYIRVKGGSAAANGSRWGNNSYEAANPLQAANNRAIFEDTTKYAFRVLNISKGNGTEPGHLEYPHCYNSYADKGKGGIGTPQYQTNLGFAGNGAGGGFVEVLFTNRTDTALALEIAVGLGGAGASSSWGTGESGQPGQATLIL